jgi:hypothetical protein
MKNVLLVGVALGLSAAGCGGMSSDPAGAHILGGDGGISLTSNGPVGGSFLVMSDFAVEQALVNAGVSDGQSISVVLTTLPAWTCASAIAATHANEGFGNVKELVFGVGNTNGNVAVGTYAFPEASGEFITTDGSCHGTPVFATGGTITFTEIASAALVGTFDLTFGSQGTVAGSFNVPLCGAPTVSGEPEPDASCVQVQ